MSTVPKSEFEEKYGGDLQRLANSVVNPLRIYTYEEPWNQTLCYKVISGHRREEEEKGFLAKFPNAEQVWSAPSGDAT
jgi:hypothetical protein